MKKLFVLAVLMFCLLVNSIPSKSTIMEVCFGVWVNVKVNVCLNVYVTDNYMEEKCHLIDVSFCRGIGIRFRGIAAIDLPDFSDPSTFITQDIIVNDFEFEDGSVSDIIIPAGEEAVLDETDGLYYTNYYIFNN